jgi:hypothetical protein
MSTGMTEAISKQLSYVLRHRPDAIGIALDRAGWVGVDELLAAVARHAGPSNARTAGQARNRMVDSFQRPVVQDCCRGQRAVSGQATRSRRSQHRSVK